MDFPALSTLVGFARLTIASRRGILSISLRLMSGNRAIFLALSMVLPSFLSRLSAERRKAAGAPGVLG
jgi:hypothetical protein